jgi:YHS domain-containing protein
LLPLSKNDVITLSKGDQVMQKRYVLSILAIVAGVLAACSNSTATTAESDRDLAPGVAEPVAEVPAEAPGEAVIASEEGEAIAEAAPETTTPDSMNLTFFSDAGIAIRGADPVAYFTQGAYVPGSAEYEYEWGNATWQFASEEHLELFAANPEQYAPQYGGFCAWAVSQGYTAPVDPNAWRIVDGKLYLNYDQSVQARWEQDIPGNIASADDNWTGLLADLLSR